MQDAVYSLKSISHLLARSLSISMPIRRLNYNLTAKYFKLFGQLFSKTGQHKKVYNVFLGFCLSTFSL